MKELIRHKKIRFIAAACAVLTVLVMLIVLSSGNTQKNEWGSVRFSLGEQSVAAATLIDWKTYDDSVYGFSFKYPQEFNVGRFLDDYREHIVVQNADKRQGFQIVISPFDEEIDITRERIKEDIRDISVEDPQPVELGKYGKGLAFLSRNNSFGKSREVWFVFDGNLYQVSTYASLDTLLQAVMNSWQFN